MLRTLLFLGIAVILGSMVIGALLGVAGLVLGFLIKALLLGIVAYVAIRIISPRTAAQIRYKIEGRPLPPW
jgi:predicted lipid-binding transport protein (Tim44 family)